MHPLRQCSWDCYSPAPIPHSCPLSPTLILTSCFTLALALIPHPLTSSFLLIVIPHPCPGQRSISTDPFTPYPHPFPSSLSLSPCPHPCPWQRSISTDPFTPYPHPFPSSLSLTPCPHPCPGQRSIGRRCTGSPQQQRCLWHRPPTPHARTHLPTHRTVGGARIILLTHTIDTTLSHTLLTHPIDTLDIHLSTHRTVDLLSHRHRLTHYQQTLSTHPINTHYQHTPYHPPLTTPSLPPSHLSYVECIASSLIAIASDRMYEAKCLVPYVPSHNVAMLVSAALVTLPLRPFNSLHSVYSHNTTLNTPY